MKLYLDPGHGGKDPGAQGNGLDEADITLDIALKLRSILLHDYEGIEVKMSRTINKFVSLSQRTNEANAWGADFFLAIHINSGSKSATGYEDYIYTNLSNSSKSAKIQDIIHAEVLKHNQLKDRGQKKANFHVLRESKMPAILTENGFIDNAHDSALMKQATWCQNVALGHANGIAKAFGLKRKATTAPKPVEKPTPATAPKPTPAEQPSKPSNSTITLYKVYAGSFESRENAVQRVGELKAKGFDSFVQPVTISEKTWYRVQVEANAVRANSEETLDRLESAGFTDSFISVEES